MFIFIYGADTYRSQQKLKEIIDSYKEIRRGGLNLEYLDSSKLDFQEFKNRIQQVSIFNEKKLIILLNQPFANIELKQKFLEEEKKYNFLTKIASSSDIVLFYEKGEVSKKDPFFIFLKQHSKSQEFQLLTGQKLKKWIEDSFKIQQSKIEPRAIQLLIDFVGNDLWRLSNEIKKLISYQKDELIKVDDVLLLVKPKIDLNIFNTIDAIAIKDKKTALNLLHSHIEKGDSLPYLFSMIVYQFRNLLIIKDLIESGRPNHLLLKETKLHPYVVQKTYKQAQRFTFLELSKIYQKILQIDTNIKTGKIDPEIALDLLVAEI